MTRRQREEEDGRKRSAEEQTDRNGLREGVERERAEERGESREARGERREEFSSAQAVEMLLARP